MNVCGMCGGAENLCRHHVKNRQSSLNKFRFEAFLNSEYNRPTDLIGAARVASGKKNWKLFINDKELQKKILLKHREKNKEYFKFNDEDVVYLCNSCHGIEHSTGEFVSNRKSLKQILYQDYDCKRIAIIEKHNIQEIKRDVGTGTTFWSGSSTPLHYQYGKCIGFRYYCSAGCKAEECKEYHGRDFRMTEDIKKELWELYQWFITERSSLE